MANKKAAPPPTPQRRNAPPNSTAARQLIHHTAESLADREALAKRWEEKNDNEVVRRALREAVRREK